MPETCITILIDSREQLPLAFGSDVLTTAATLTAGDYSVSGLEDRAAIERKSLSDLVACVGPERDRFTRELLRLRGYPCRALVIEATLQDITDHRYRSATSPASVVGSLAAWSTRYGVPVWFAGDPAGAALIVATILRNYHREVLDLLKKLTQATPPPSSAADPTPRS